MLQSIRMLSVISRTASTYSMLLVQPGTWQNCYSTCIRWTQGMAGSCNAFQCLLGMIRSPGVQVNQSRPWSGLAQDGTAQHSTAQHSTAQHSTAQHSTAQHSTAQHSTAQHSTAQHSTAQHSTAQHSSTDLATLQALHSISSFRL